MKKIYSILFSIVVFFLTCTSCSSDSLEFKGIPIKGTKEEFGKELVKKGFVHQGSSYYGLYYGEQVEITIFEFIKSEPYVNEVMVEFRNREDLYKSLVSDLTKKYGSPSKEKSHYAICLPNPDDDIYNYYWHLKTGTISLYRLPMGNKMEQIILKYEVDLSNSRNANDL